MSYKIPRWSGAPRSGFEIEVRDGDEVVERLDGFKKGFYYFGRDRSACDFVIDDESASRIHAVLQFHNSGDSAYLYDLASANGTLINDRKVKNETYVCLIDGDIIRFGMSTKSYQFHAPPEYKDIHHMDVPERLQLQMRLRGSGSTLLDDDSLTSESNWIFDYLTKAWISNSHLANVVKVDDIRRFLELQHVEKLDLPFIAMYKREACPSLFEQSDYPPEQHKPELKWHKVLWAIQDLDLEWLNLQKQKQELKDRLLKCFDNKSQMHDEMGQSFYRKILQSSINFLEGAISQREVEDVEMTFDFHSNQEVLPIELNEISGKNIWEQVWKTCRHNVKSVYSLCSKAGLLSVACHLTPGCKELGYVLEDPTETPLKIATSYQSRIFRTPKLVLKGARFLAAIEICLDPIIRQIVRGKCSDGFVICSKLYKDMWPEGKKLNEIKDEELFHIQKAKDDGTDFNLMLLDDDVKDLLRDLKALYLHVDDAAISVGPWHQEREKILETAFFRYLMPSMKHEARTLCRNRVQSWLRFEYGEALRKRVSVIPNQWKRSNGSGDHVVPKIIASCLGPGTGTTFVVVDSSGEMLDKLYIEYLTDLSHDSAVLKQQDRDKVLKWMMEYKPDVVVLPPSAILRDEIPKITSQMTYHIDVVFSGDEPFACLHSDVVKHALAFGRYHQNPLALAATLCGPGREILTWKLCRSENFLTPDEGYTLVVQVMVDVTNQVGIDINLAGTHEWLLAPLQFISGLGPRKAEYLQRSIVQNGARHTLEEFKKRYGLGEKVYANAAPFLCVRKSLQSETSRNAQEEKVTEMSSLVIDSAPAGVVPFVRDLWNALCTNQKSVKDALLWSDERRFRIVSHVSLEAILQLHFPNTLFANFFDQLKLYGFVFDGFVWQHEEDFFRKDKPELLLHIKAKTMSSLFSNPHLSNVFLPPKKGSSHN